jgi:magnesium chelatase subunit I
LRDRYRKEIASMVGEQAVFPFVRIVGQEEMKKALLLNIVDPTIGGVLLKGEKGTAKSTTVRSLGQVLPEVGSSKGCPFHCDPSSPRHMCEACRARHSEGALESERRRMRVVELPLSATEDRISGSLDIEHVLRTGEKKFEGGVLAQANGNLLYVDEVNLLDDHIVDLLLDSAAMGVNYVEREGVSFSHPARFVLVGSMNPEEGSLRPQLLDRFGLSVDIRGETDIDTRMEVIRRRLEFDSDPEGYLESCLADTAALGDRIVRARALLPDVEVDDRTVHSIALISIRFKIEGHRADIALMKVAKANAALDGRTSVTEADLVSVAPMVLTHRLKKGPFEEAVLKKEDLIRCLRGY